MLLRIALVTRIPMVSTFLASLLGLAVGALLGAPRIDGGLWPSGLLLTGGVLLGMSVAFAWQGARRWSDGGDATVREPGVAVALDPTDDGTALRTEFLSTVAHELRTPLTSVKGSLQLVLGKSGGLRAIDRELLAISLKNADRLIRLINNLLDISKLELGKVELAPTLIDPRAMIDEAVAGLRTYAEERGVSLASACDGDVPSIRADHDRMMQVLTNLISNAVKFSPPGAAVHVQGRRIAGDLAIAVSDRGCGISAEDQPRLFQRFQRLDPNRSSESGTGLGLAISKAIMDRHGGRIAVESQEGEGSTFTVLLPIGTASSTSDQAHDQTLPRILIIGGTRTLWDVVTDAVGQAGTVVVATRGVDALAQVRPERPVAILLANELPDLGTDEVLAILQHGGVPDATPVVLIAAGHVTGRASGVADVLAFPQEEPRLEAMVREFVSKPC